MRLSEALRVHRAAIRPIVEAHRALNARVFGSVVRGDDTDDSDLDILIDPTPETTLFDIGIPTRAFAWDCEASIEGRWTGRAGVKFSEILSVMPDVGEYADFEHKQSTRTPDSWGKL